jgi:BirA family transcriptional regulator, biotin operon repressor / biotin---[acetyl-CoA-carboxylase] ligase
MAEPPAASGSTAARERRRAPLAPPLGAPRLHLRRCDSTNARARELAIAGAPHGTLVTADEQTAGRGRQGRAWLAPAGSCLLCSLVLRGQTDALLPLIAGVALCEAIGRDSAIKWPNDVVLAGGTAKVAGILVEGRPQEDWAVLGVGVNVALRLDELPPDVRARAGTLGLDGAAVEPLLASLLAALRRRLGEPAAASLRRWRALDALRGRRVAWERGDGLAEGIDEQGRLLVRLPDGGTQALQAGEVHLTGVS